MQRGAPNYDRMSASLAAKIRRQAPELQAMFKALGTVESIFFRGVGPGGYDIYGVKFANGFAEFRLLLAADGKADDVIFRPDGNDAPGGVAACSERAGFEIPGRHRADQTCCSTTAAAQTSSFTSSDAEGKRTAQGTIGENMSSSVLTYVDSPWVVADTSGTMSGDRAAGTAHALSYGRGAPVRTVSQSARCRGARLPWLGANRCCANTSRRWGAANRTTIA